MKRFLGEWTERAEWIAAWLLMVGGALAQGPEQRWQSTPNYPANNPQAYQPSTAPANQPATGNPPSPAASGQYQYQYTRQPDQPVGPPQYPAVERQTGPAGQAYVSLPPDNRATYPQQDPRMPGRGGPIQGLSGPPAGQQIQGPPVRPAPPQTPFVLTLRESIALENLLADWEKRNKEIHVLESKFFRWKYDAAFGNASQPPLPDEGILKFASPDKGLIKIDAKDPKQSEQWLCDGKSVYQFNYRNNEVTEYVMPPELQGKGIGDGPLPFVFGVEAQKLKQRYFMHIITPHDVQNEAWLEAFPRFQHDAAEFSKVQVILQIVGPTKALFPFAIKIFTPNGKDSTVYQLQDPLINRRSIWLPGMSDWWKVSIPYGWKKKLDLPPAPVQTGLNAAMPPRR
jgi:TIGR03009 family protein